MNSQPITVTLAALPESGPRWRMFAASLGAQLVGVLLLCQVGLLMPQRLVLPKHYEITTIVAPSLEEFTAKPVPVAAARPRPTITAPKLEAPEVAVLRVPPPERRPVPPPVPAPVLRDVISTVKPAVQAVVAQPAPVVHTGGFGGQEAAPIAGLPRAQVQTGGFGDPNGSRATGVARPQLAQARIGSFDLPAGPGYGNGTGGARGVRGAVASTGFGSGVAAPAARSNPGGTVQSVGFGDARPVAPERHTAIAAPVAAPTPVEIISKPRPVYSDEARRLKIEGEVLLEARFGANGELQVLGVRRGLGHGLDEAAMRAAQQIRFRPARQDGVPVDSIASLHVVFQLAY